MKIEDPRPKLIQASALILTLTSLVPTIVVPIFVNQSYYFTLAGVANTCMFATLYLIIANNKPQYWHRYLVISMGYLSIVPLIIVSGGINSQFTSLLTVSPVMVALLSNNRDSKIVTVLTVLFILSLLFYHDNLISLSNETISIDRTRSRATWLILGCLLGAGFAQVFNQTNQKLRAALTKRAYQDELTGLPNRRNIMEILQQKLSNYQANDPIAILMIDVDHFKKLNDSYGHLFGDECLQAVSRSISESIQTNRGVVGRYGGEEFLAILSDVTPDEAVNLAQNIRRNIADLKLQTHDKQPVRITVTIGWDYVELTEHLAVSSILNPADKALYVGKQQGRNQVVAATATHI